MPIFPLAGEWLMRARIATGAAVALAVAVIAIIALPGGAGHRVSLVIPDAADLIPGLKVRAAGQAVGEISRVATIDGGRLARVDLTIADATVWPLPPDTRFIVRFGGTVAYAARYIEMERGISSAPPFADGATIPSTNVTVPVEFADLINTFGPRTQANLHATVNALGAAMPPASSPLRRSLDAAPAAVQQAAGVFGDLAAEDTALDGLVRSTADVAGAASAADPGLSSLIGGTATTFQAVGSRASELRSALAQLPDTLARTRATLARADATLIPASALVARLSPGVTQLTALSRPLRHALGTIVTVGPDAVSALGIARRSAPAITSLLDRATSLLPQLRSLGSQGTRQLACIRPYSPEIAGFASTWASFVDEGDHKDKYARMYLGSYPFTNATPMTVPQAAQVLPSAFAGWAFPRPPGANVGKPWFLPGCDITPTGMDPARDPEAAAVDPLSKPIVRSNTP
jgi:phospholipid/cholesterol/gamma-HCH transport system substrate-binding protein